MYVVLAVKNTFSIEMMGVPVDLPISDLADGCVGAMLVFDTKENAEAWANECEVVEIQKCTDEESKDV